MLAFATQALTCLATPANTFKSPESNNRPLSPENPAKTMPTPSASEMGRIMPASNGPWSPLCGSFW